MKPDEVKQLLLTNDSADSPVAAGEVNDRQQASVAESTWTRILARIADEPSPLRRLPAVDTRDEAETRASLTSVGRFEQRRWTYAATFSAGAGILVVAAVAAFVSVHRSSNGRQNQAATSAQSSRAATISSNVFQASPVSGGTVVFNLPNQDPRSLTLDQRRATLVARWLETLPPQPSRDEHCPFDTGATDIITLTSEGTEVVRAVVQPTGCGFVRFTSGGAAFVQGGGTSLDVNLRSL